CPVYSNGIDKELVTPTGAAIATTLARSFGSPPPMILKQVGLGAGSLDLPIPNILRLWIGEISNLQTSVTDVANTHHHSEHHAEHYSESHSESHLEPISVLETQIDDLNPQAIGYIFDALFAAGAVDVFTQSIG
ncbi:MAG: nickel insertion protein, partial [Sphaerospermopsis kisseleviana]